VRHTWRSSCLVILDYLIEALGLGVASLGEDIFYMVFWLLMVMGVISWIEFFYRNVSGFSLKVGFPMINSCVRVATVHV
jgi:hypothetical protein